MIKIYTDGSCIGNPGTGGWAAVIINGKNEKVISGSKNNTTNNQMELLAAIKALSNFNKKKSLKIFTDSNYVKDGITKWIKNWEKNNWKTSAKKPVKNQELWKKLDKLVKFHDVKWEWVKGHSTNIYNNLADELARKAAEKN
jgi:ribonuclease HI|tara:strand:+ start:956 stop:1381 length:426 start_codon:yes stop_codon:yes gene_type:complete